MQLNMGDRAQCDGGTSQISIKESKKKESASVNSRQLTQHLPVLVLKNQLVSPMQKFLLKSMSLRQKQAFSQTAVPHRSFGQKF